MTDWKQGHQVGVVDGEPVSCGEWSDRTQTWSERLCWLGPPLYSAYVASRLRFMQERLRQFQDCRPLPRPRFAVYMQSRTGVKGVRLGHREDKREAGLFADELAVREVRAARRKRR